MRLNKLISDSGLCSRREADELIAAGRVTVDGEVADIGIELAGGELVCVDGNEVRARGTSGARKVVYIALYKPEGITSTTEREVDGNIVDFVDHAERIFPIGRLDKDSEGLILLTNDGDVVNPILRAENRHEKEYLVEVNHPVTPEFLRGMARGVQLDRHTLTQPCKVGKLGRYGFRIVLTQGLNRQIRRMAQAFGYRVKILRRVRIMHIQLGHLKPGQWRNLTPAEVAGLMKHCEDAVSNPPPRKARVPQRGARAGGRDARAGTRARDADGRDARPDAPARGASERTDARTRAGVRTVVADTRVRGARDERTSAYAGARERTPARKAGEGFRERAAGAAPRGGAAMDRRVARDERPASVRGSERDGPRSPRFGRNADAATTSRRGGGRGGETMASDSRSRPPRGRGRR